MREYKFRGMTIGGHWVYGNLSVLPKKLNSSTPAGSYISNSAGMPFAYELRPETVGEFTGLKDSKGVEIWEGDIVTWYVNDIIRTAPVAYVDEQGSFWMMKDRTTGQNVINDWMRGEYEIIGNIHENQNLL